MPAGLEECGENEGHVGRRKGKSENECTCTARAIDIFMMLDHRLQLLDISCLLSLASMTRAETT